MRQEIHLQNENPPQITSTTFGAQDRRLMCKGAECVETRRRQGLDEPGEARLGVGIRSARPGGSKMGYPQVRSMTIPSWGLRIGR